MLFLMGVDFIQYYFRRHADDITNHHAGRSPFPIFMPHAVKTFDSIYYIILIENPASTRRRSQTLAFNMKWYFVLIGADCKRVSQFTSKIRALSNLA